MLHLILLSSLLFVKSRSQKLGAQHTGKVGWTPLIGETQSVQDVQLPYFLFGG